MLEKAERELAKLTGYIDQERFNWRLDRERANGAEAEVAELRDAVAWYFECVDKASELSAAGITTNTGHAEQQLRSLAGGEDGG